MRQNEEAAVPFTATLERYGRVPVVKVYGEVDLGSYRRFQALLAEAAAEVDGLPYMVVDLSRVTFMDSMGLGVIVEQYKELAETRDGSLRLVLRGGVVARIFEVTGMDQKFPTYPDVRSAAEDTGSLNGNLGF